MQYNEKYNLECFLFEEINKLYNILNKIDLIILQRTYWTFELEGFINIAKKNNIKVIFDIDDLIYSPKYVPEYLNNIGIYSENHINYFFAYSKRLEMVAELCEGFIVTTEKLYKNIKNDFNKPTWIFHSYLNLEQEKVFRYCFIIKEKFLFK